MPADLYRDAHLGIRARLGELDVRIREAEAELTDEFWASLDVDQRGQLTDLRSSLDEVGASSLEALAHAEGRLATYVERLERLVDHLPSREEEWRTVPDIVADPPLYDGAPPLPRTFDAVELERSFRNVVSERTREAVFVSDGDDSWLARFRHRDAPFVLRATAVTIGRVTDVAMQLVTSVARGAPRLLVRHESLWASVGKTFGLWRDLAVGDESFDGLFLIEGSQRAADRLLVPAIRAHLLALARFDVPTLEVDPPSRTASLTWCFEPQDSALEAALRVLSFIRDAESEVRFRR